MSSGNPTSQSSIGPFINTKRTEDMYVNDVDQLVVDYIKAKTRKSSENIKKN